MSVSVESRLQDFSSAMAFRITHLKSGIFRVP